MKTRIPRFGLCAIAAALLALAADPTQGAGLTRNPGGASASGHSGYGSSQSGSGGGHSGYGGGHSGYGGGHYNSGRSYYRGGYYGGHSHYYGGYGSRFGLWLGASLNPWRWGSPSYPGYYYDPYPYAYSYPYRYYAAPTVVVQPQPQPQSEELWWYYCQDPPGYYPYVAQCASGWRRVAPTPEPAPSPAAEYRPAEPPVPPAPPPQETQASPPQAYRWFYCQDPAGYYPTVRDCPKGWLQVEPASEPPR